LPVINTANLKDPQISNLLQHKIHRKLRFPFYEFLPDEEISSALKTSTGATTVMVPNQKNLALLSQTLPADIVLAVEIVEAHDDLQNTFAFRADDKTIETTEVILRCYAYSAKDNHYFILKAERFNSVELSTTSDLFSAADIVSDELMQKIPFPTIILSTPEIK